MALTEDARFGRAPFSLSAAELTSVLQEHRGTLQQDSWTHCGFAEVPSWPDGLRPAADVSARVDNAFRFGADEEFEALPVVVTTGVRSSRFAAVVFWEVLHKLEPGGLWIDVDEAGRCHGSPLTSVDYLDRAYFEKCLARERRRASGDWLVQAYRKTRPTPLADRIDDDGWTFGILTSGPSPRAARMARDILALDLPRLEVLFCGPRPDDAPADRRVRTIDLARPEPRGWISRKKNLLADAARYENLCLLHDRFVITPEWAEALRGVSPALSVATFPQVFYIDRDRQFTQRYADYQVLYQREALREALATNVYVGERIFYAPYDDFCETAFCCGGLYLAKRSIWTDVRQDESLYHCEWEDVSFGLACQTRGIPHRVERTLTVESMTPHPMALTRLHDLVAPDAPVLGRLHVGAAQATAARATPHRFVPVMGVTRTDYYEKVLDRLNASPTLARQPRPLSQTDVRACTGLSDFWRVIERHLLQQPDRSRDWYIELAAFLAATIYPWPNCELLTAIRDNERDRDLALRSGPRRRVREAATLAGWGTGSLFRATHATLIRPLDFVVDRDPAAWGTRREGVEVKSPESLGALDPAQTVVVVFSCEFDAVAASIRALGDFETYRVEEVASADRLHPLSEMITHFEEVERYYPALFLDALTDADERCAA